ncbi:hypothetical protein QA644_08190 [Rhizobium sp. CC1099]|uniref:hypothetical protein n=1 Tax=Rhizobium sp. CC1099 TaxID=3039160 RepID=UPI0024B0C468|nr:hypothetical protein [Rhizobium sp. CC1099]WFU89008.1 hypothetical protein QA644_08190 [Rhizobium sp. CC1099]
MSNIESNEVIALADEFVELMRADDERPFGLREFSVFVSVRLGHEATIWDPDVEGALIKRFNDHYDLVRQDLGMRWDFVNGYVEGYLSEE